VAVAAYAEPGIPDHSVGERLTTEGDNISSKVWHTQRAARMDRWESAGGSIAERVRMLGLRSRVGAPIVVDERVWGMAVVGTSQPDPLPPDTEQRVAEFADLAATTIAAATTYAELIASRARIVAAADDARRRIERDLHDGAQQRLIALGPKVRMAMDRVRTCFTRRPAGGASWCRRGTRCSTRWTLLTSARLRPVSCCRPAISSCCPAGGHRTRMRFSSPHRCGLPKSRSTSATSFRCRRDNLPRGATCSICPAGLLRAPN
jgi:GAF domain